MRKLSPFIVLLLLSTSLLYGQSKKIFKNQTISYSELTKILNPAKWDTIVFEGITFNGDLGKQIWEDSVWGKFTVSNSVKANKVRAIEFIECNFPTSIFFDGRFEGYVSLDRCTGPKELIFQNCYSLGLSISESTFENIHIKDSQFKDLRIEVTNENMPIILYKVAVDTGYAFISGNHIHIHKSTFITQGDSSMIENNGQGNAWTSVWYSQFDQLDSGFLQFEQKDGLIRLRHSRFGGNVDFYADGDKVSWDLVGNDYKKKVGFRSMAEIGPASYINFKEIFRGKSLGWHLNENDTTIFYDGRSNQIAEERHYLNLLRLHKRLHNFYMEGGDIQTANLVYTRIKDLETHRLVYEYKVSPSFDLWIRIGLNRLLKFYTHYGTDPARAIGISLWVIFIFGIFYFFFPSSWDLSSKSKLISDFKNLKNIKAGRYKKILSISVGVTIAILNALTLSLNSFITLGFGEIPTKGLARYMTIGEGFLGWFLLTLFTVALISQSSF